MGAGGAVHRVERTVERPVVGESLSIGPSFTSSCWSPARLSRSRLRFLDAERLSGFFTEAGFEVEEQFGDCDRSPLTEVSPEIITMARRA